MRADPRAGIDVPNRQLQPERSLRSEHREHAVVSFVVDMRCSQAAGFIKTLITQTLPITTPGAINDLIAGPGYTCIAYPDKNGHAYAGSCLSGSTRFDWNYNVMWHGVPDSSAGEGGLGIEPMGTIEYTTVLRPLANDRYSSWSATRARSARSTSSHGRRLPG